MLRSATPGGCYPRMDPAGSGPESPRVRTGMETPDYKATLNLPQTAFPMKANLAQLEPKLLARWAEIGLYEKILARNAGKPPFVFHDGPPYANGHIHLGHILNKILKDLVVKFHNQQGELSDFIPGWDCHGLPIELNVDK